MNSDPKSNTTCCEKENSDTAVATAPKRSYARPVHRVKRDEENNVTLEADIPGVPKANVSIEVEDGVLTVTAERAETALPEGWRPVHRELARSDYRLSLKLGSQLDPDAIAATVADGQLTLTVPVREAARRRSIEVN